MKTKPTIRYDEESKRFTLDKNDITDAEARTRWDAADCDWSQGAYAEMARRVMQ